MVAKIEAMEITTRGELEKLTANLKAWEKLLPEKLPRTARAKVKPVAKAKSAAKRVLPSRKASASNAAEATPPTAA
jgi:hypothetical protein